MKKHVIGSEKVTVGFIVERRVFFYLRLSEVNKDLY